MFRHVSRPGAIRNNHSLGTLTEVTALPTNGTFYNIEGTFPPSPFDPFPDLSLYSDGSGNYFYSNPDGRHWRGRHGAHGGRSTADDSPPDPFSLGGSGGVASTVSNAPLPNFFITTNFSQYTNFWLAISNSPTQAFVCIMSTLPGFSYDILTNSDLSTTNWGVWQALLATNSFTPAPPLNLDGTNLFFNARLDFGDTFWVNTNPAPQELAEWLMGTNPVVITNVTYTGSGVARGIFGNGCTVRLNTNAPRFLDRGVIFSTGWATNAYGPNDNSGDNGWIYGGALGPSDLGEPGDDDLDDLVGGGATFDAAALEFDIVATNSFELQFEFVFASEEYPEFIANFNDLVAIFVSTNFNGSNWVNNITNDIALVPGTTNSPISVSSINGGCVSQWDYPYNSDPATNPQYYLDNDDPGYYSLSPYAASSPVYNLQYDGFTTNLSAQIYIRSGVTNHIKIVIADYGDSIYDSAIFIKAKTPFP